MPVTTEELEAQNAELRSVLSLVRQRLRQEFMDDREVMPKIEHALSTECGRDHVPREELECMTKERDEWWKNCEKLAQEHNAKVAELERVQAQAGKMREAIQ